MNALDGAMRQNESSVGVSVEEDAVAREIAMVDASLLEVDECRRDIT